MPTPMEGYYDRADPHSATGTMSGFMYETAKWATWRNPFFLGRVGRSGWDTAAVQGDGTFAKMHRGLYRGMNLLMAPDARRQHEIVIGEARRAAMAGFKPLDPEDFAPRYSVYTRGYAAAEATQAGSNIAARAAAQDVSKRKENFFMRVLGEPGKNRPELAAQAFADRHRGDMWSVLMGDKKVAGISRHGAGAFIAGRALARLNAAMWVYDIGKLGMSGAGMVAKIGAQQRFVPSLTYGPGVQDNHMAATLRQSAMMDMYQSEYGNRRVMGNEARLLHT